MVWRSFRALARASLDWCNSSLIASHSHQSNGTWATIGRFPSRGLAMIGSLSTLSPSYGGAALYQEARTCQPRGKGALLVTAAGFAKMGKSRHPARGCPMNRRSRAREVALQLLFWRDHNPGAAREAVERFVRERLRDSVVAPYCLTLFDGVAAQQAVIDERLTEAAENWRLSRMAAVDRNVLRLGA